MIGDDGRVARRVEDRGRQVDVTGPRGMYRHGTLRTAGEINRDGTRGVDVVLVQDLDAIHFLIGRGVCVSTIPGGYLRMPDGLEVADTQCDGALGERIVEIRTVRGDRCVMIQRTCADDLRHARRNDRIPGRKTTAGGDQVDPVAAGDLLGFRFLFSQTDNPAVTPTAGRRVD